MSDHYDDYETGTGTRQGDSSGVRPPFDDRPKKPKPDNTDQLLEKILNKLIKSAVSMATDGYLAPDQRIQPHEAKAKILKHYRSVEDIERAIPEKYPDADKFETAPYKMAKRAEEKAFNRAVDKIRKNLNLGGSDNE